METVKNRGGSRRLPALVLVMGISLALGVSLFIGDPGPVLPRLYRSVQPPEIVSYKNVIQITETEIDELRFLAIGGKQAKVINKDQEEFFVYTSFDGILFFPLYLTGSGE